MRSKFTALALAGGLLGLGASAQAAPVTSAGSYGVTGGVEAVQMMTPMERRMMRRRMVRRDMMRERMMRQRMMERRMMRRRMMMRGM